MMTGAGAASRIQIFPPGTSAIADHEGGGGQRSDAAAIAPVNPLAGARVLTGCKRAGARF